MYLSLEAVAYENNIDFLEVVSKALASRVPIFFELKYPDKLMVKTGFLKDWLLYGIRLKLKKHELYAGQFKPSFFDKEGVTVCILQEGMFRIIKGRGGIGATRLSDNGSLVWLDLIEGVVDKATYSIPLGYGKMKDAVPPPAEGIEPKYLSILECDEKELYSVLGISSLEILKDKKNAESIIKTNNKQSQNQKHQVKREEKKSLEAERATNNTKIVPVYRTMPPLENTSVHLVFSKSEKQNLKGTTRFGYGAIEQYKLIHGNDPRKIELWKWILDDKCKVAGFEKEVINPKAINAENKKIKIIEDREFNWDYFAFSKFYDRCMYKHKLLK